MKNKLLIVLLFVFYAAVSRAEEPSVNDFAYSYKIEFSPGNSLYEATLPADIYENVTRPDLGDIRVFNAAEELVPHEIVSSELKVLEKAIAAPVPLKYFPLRGVHKGGANSGVKIQASPLGTIVAIEQSEKDTSAAAKTIVSYIIDASGIEQTLHSLELEVSTSDEMDFFRRVQLTGSNDLKIWKPLEDNVVLAKLGHQGQTLKENIISLNDSRYKYYQLSWSDDEAELKISSVVGNFGTTAELVPPELKWETISGVPESKDKQDKLAFLYELKGFFPVSAIRIPSTQPNSIYSVVLEARNNSSEEWQHRAEGRVYSLEKDGVKFEATELPLATTERYKYWRLRFNSPQAVVGKLAPQLKFGWESEKLMFLARGTSPFVLGFGNARAEPMETINLRADVIFESKGVAQLTERKVVGGEAKLTYVPPKVYPWKSWILWTVLIVGVFTLGKMAFSLMKTMKNDESLE